MAGKYIDKKKKNVWSNGKKCVPPPPKKQQLLSFSLSQRCQFKKIPGYACYKHL
jgi:hypothetical protein